MNLKKVFAAAAAAVLISPGLACASCASDAFADRAVAVCQKSITGCVAEEKQVRKVAGWVGMSGEDFDKQMIERAKNLKSNSLGSRFAIALDILSEASVKSLILERKEFR
ncbi:hypothetical protein MIZ01_1590 [Sideroxyarcus emersonii]|uniref:Lipoprotein n=1 Tax=Sideroxyarcus emersonii TaxID=2764705 RepID=A0AAN1XAW8_9PROT|nr:hypothetical protein [Sideroxyarcus emersonii]BCK87794.1 hypothetical protein MIZ01_1590 [Sideroxyarcus emersonii]